MPVYKGSKTYLIIPEGRWGNQVPALISQEDYPSQSIGWFVDSVWYRPTWTEARNHGDQLGPVIVMNDTGRVPNVQWWITSFAVNKHPPFLRYPDSSKGIHEAINLDATSANYAVTGVGALDAATPSIHYLTNQEAVDIKSLSRMELVVS